MSTAATAEFETVQHFAADERDRPLPLRGDTILGVCEAIGHDFGFNANFLRISFAALLLWNPAVIIGVYLALGCVVALSRWMFPAARPAESAIGDEASQAAELADEEAGERLAA